MIVLRYFVIIFAGYLTYISVLWSFGYADRIPPEHGAMTSLVIAAVEAPVLALNAYLAKKFLNG